MVEANMASKTAIIRRRRAERITSAAFANAAEAAVGLDELTRPLLQGDEEPPDWALAVVLPARLIVERLEDLLVDDRDLADRRLTDARLREVRDRRTRALRAKLVDLRRAAAAVLGKTAIRRASPTSS